MVVRERVPRLVGQHRQRRLVRRLAGALVRCAGICYMAAAVDLEAVERIAVQPQRPVERVVQLVSPELGRHRDPPRVPWPATVNLDPEHATGAIGYRRLREAGAATALLVL